MGFVLVTSDLPRHPTLSFGYLSPRRALLIVSSTALPYGDTPRTSALEGLDSYTETGDSIRPPTRRSGRRRLVALPCNEPSAVHRASLCLGSSERPSRLLFAPYSSPSSVFSAARCSHSITKKMPVIPSWSLPHSWLYLSLFKISSGKRVDLRAALSLPPVDEGAGLSYLQNLFGWARILDVARGGLRRWCCIKKHRELFAILRTEGSRPTFQYRSFLFDHHRAP
ncbi:hypothetical protein R3P38DRAFT_3182935 [Favolaschia claudopus]|uniref:Uncharacterized protein n=1 Tax=Favolaschia claudopus TaxID=2862362 RepID=A0AAW0CCT8_9AGAR